ncbi:hypothetical protein ACFLXY_11500 [Chloroflexota bacterium]
MALQIGDTVEYKGDMINGEYPRGKVIIIEKNSRDFITSYFVLLYEGILVQFKPHNLNWHKLEE